MNIHFSTLRYWLERIQPLLGINLDDPEFRLLIQVAVRLDRQRPIISVAR